MTLLLNRLGLRHDLRTSLRRSGQPASQAVRFYVEQYLTLVSALCERFRADRRVPAAVLLLHLRASGCPLGRVAIVSKNLLRPVRDALGLPTLTIARLRSLYQRRPTLPVFRTLWLAWLMANTIMWMSDVAAAWVMTSLATSALWVALVSAAATLPVFLLGLPSGALADMLDRRRYFMATQWWVAAIACVTGSRWWQVG